MVEGAFFHTMAGAAMVLPMEAANSSRAVFMVIEIIFVLVF